MSRSDPEVNSLLYSRSAKTCVVLNNGAERKLVRQLEDVKKRGVKIHRRHLLEQELLHQELLRLNSSYQDDYSRDRNPSGLQRSGGVGDGFLEMLLRFKEKRRKEKIAAEKISRTKQWSRYDEIRRINQLGQLLESGHLTPLSHLLNFQKKPLPKQGADRSVVDDMKSALRRASEVGEQTFPQRARVKKHPRGPLLPPGKQRNNTELSYNRTETLPNISTSSQSERRHVSDTLGYFNQTRSQTYPIITMVNDTTARRGQQGFSHPPLFDDGEVTPKLKITTGEDRDNFWVTIDETGGDGGQERPPYIHYNRLVPKTGDNEWDEIRRCRYIRRRDSFEDVLETGDIAEVVFGRDSPVFDRDSPVFDRDSPVFDRDSPVFDRESSVSDRDSPVTSVNTDRQHSWNHELLVDDSFVH